MRKFGLVAFAAIMMGSAASAATERLTCGEDYTATSGDTVHLIASKAYGPGLHRQRLVNILMHRHGQNVGALSEGTTVAIPCATGAGFDLPKDFWSAASGQPTKVVVQTVGYAHADMAVKDGLPPLFSVLIEEAMLEGRLSAEFRKLGAISFAAYRPFPVDAAVGDISFPWLGSDCAGGDGQSAQLDHLCTKSYWSDPIFELTSAAYVPAGSVSGTLTPGRLCIADESRAAVQKSGFLNNAGVQRSVAGSAEECIAMIQEGLVTAVIVPDVAAAKQNRQTPRGKLLQRVPGAEFSDTIHAVVDKANPAGERILKRLNDGIEKIRVNGE